MKVSGQIKMMKVKYTEVPKGVCMIGLFKMILKSFSITVPNKLIITDHKSEHVYSKYLLVSPPHRNFVPIVNLINCKRIML